MNLFLAIYTLSAIVSAVICFGACLAHLQKKYPAIAEQTYGDDVFTATFFGLACGIISIAGLVLIYSLSEKFRYGLMYRKPTALEYYDMKYWGHN